MFNSNNRFIDLASFREQLRKDIAGYIHERSQGKMNYSTCEEMVFSKQNLVINHQERKAHPLTKLPFGSEETGYLEHLIVVIEKVDISYDLRDRVNTIYQSMPKYFSFFYPIVLLSDRLKVTLIKYPRERLMELELEKNREHQLHCDVKIKNVTEEYQKALKLYEGLSDKIGEFSTVENLEKEELSRQLVSAQTQRDEFRKQILLQEKKIVSLEKDKLSLYWKNKDQKQVIDLLEQDNQKLQKQLKQLQSSYESLFQKFEQSPIKTEEDLEKFSQQIVGEVVKKLNTAPRAPEQQKHNSPKLFSIKV